MAKRKIKYTRTELKRQRDALARFQRYLPTLKLKQQQIQSSIVKLRQSHKHIQALVQQIDKVISSYQGLFNDIAAVNIKQLSEPDNVKTTKHSIAGVNVPQFENVSFPQADYSLFGTAAWTDQVLADMRNRNRHKTEMDILQECITLLQAELKKVMQRVNLFEKVMIPDTIDNIRKIRIALGDQMTAGVARAKIAKAKLKQKQQQDSSVEAAAV